MKITGIVGSRRKNGNSSTIVKEVLNSAKNSGADTELVYLGDYHIKPCFACEACKDSFKCVINDDFHKIISLIKESNGIVIASPTYWYNVSGDMKIFIDRCYSLIKFSKTDRSIWISAFEDQGKCSVPVAICEQHEESMMGYTYDTLKKVMTDLDLKVITGIKGLGYFKSTEANEDETVLLKAKKAGEKLVKAIELKNK